MTAGGSWAIPWQCALVLVYLVTLVGLLLYGSNAYVMVIAHRRYRRAMREVPPLPDPLPYVTVQLPLFNERYVAARLVRAVAALDYPADRLEIQVLDDSTDDTAEIVAGVVGELRARGVRVAHCRRTVRTGFKAGALAEGLATARGEFIAIFDADFVPPRDFLQARWGHLNRSYSALTVAQSLGIDGHFGVEQSARCWSGLLLNFNSTAGVWRRTAILDAGGWTYDTLTEDLDLSYRAQLRGWTIVYRSDIVCPAELPVLVTGFKSQQRRWAMGTIQTALKLLPAVWKAELPLWTCYQAFVHLGPRRSCRRQRPLHDRPARGWPVRPARLRERLHLLATGGACRGGQDPRGVGHARAGADARERPRDQASGLLPVGGAPGQGHVRQARRRRPERRPRSQVMAFNAATGRVYAMEPPRKVRNLKANFPQGVYQLEIDTSQAPINPRDWHFVVADHQCNTTDILSFPHEPKSPRVIR